MAWWGGGGFLQEFPHNYKEHSKIWSSRNFLIITRKIYRLIKEPKDNSLYLGGHFFFRIFLVIRGIISSIDQDSKYLVLTRNFPHYY